MEVLANWIWQGCVVALAAALLLRVLDRSRAPLRALLCWAGLGAVLALPLLPLLGTSAPVATAGGAPPILVPRAWWTSGVAFGGAWALWFTVAALRLARAALAVRQAKRRCGAFPAALEARLDHWQRLRGTGRRARLRLSDDVADAAVLGGRSPVIAVSPRLLGSLRPDELDRVVIHEWAHVRRRDDYLHLLQRAAAAIAGWHPAVWWLDRRLALEREIACDEIAVSATGSPKQYAACLAALASLGSAAAPALPVPAALSSSALARRVGRILAPTRLASRGRTAAAGSACVLVLAVLCVSASGVRLVDAVATSGTADVENRSSAPAEMPVPLRAAAVTTPASDADRLATLSAGEGLAPFDASRQSAPNRSRPAARAQPTRPRDTPSAAPAPLVAARAPQLYEAPSVAGGLVESPPAVEAVFTPGTTTGAAAARPLDRGPSPTAWGAAVEAGVAAADGSKRAGVAAAGFFNRLGRRVAGSF